MLTSFASRFVRPGAAVWDIGANVGLFTFAAAGLAESTGYVLAVEPDTWLVENLKRSTRLNASRSIAQLDILPIAIGRSARILRFYIANNNRATNYVVGKGSSVTGGPREEALVPTLSLDTLLDHVRAPDVLKVDVEGAEVDVLAGAERVLTEIRPVLLIEVSAITEVTSILTEAGYGLFDADGDTQAPIEQCTFNTIALPLDKYPVPSG